LPPATDRGNSYRLTLYAASLTCALLPWYTVRWHIGRLPTTLLEGCLVLTIAVFLVEASVQGATIEWRTPFTVPALLFIVAGALDVIFAPDRWAALGLYRAYLLEPIAFFIVLLSVVRTLRRAYLILLGLALAALAIGLPNAFVVVQAGLQHRLDLSATPPVVIYQTANAVALFLLPVISVAGGFAAYGKGRVRAAAVAFLLVSVPCLLLTLSRGGFLALGAVVLALALTHRRRIWYLAAAVVAGAAFALLPPISKRLAYELHFTDPHNTLVGRIPLWQATMEMLRHNLIFGAGLSGFETRIAPYWNATHIDRFIYPHNILLNFWAATGIIGVVAFAWLLLQGFRTSWAGWRPAARDWAPLHLGVLLALIGIVIHGLVDVPYFKNDLSLEFWVLLALTSASLRWIGGQAASAVTPFGRS
jgi:putative inorganic carbon (hco3(-)) transporter